jgi:hypothetical protein
VKANQTPSQDEVDLVEAAEEILSSQKENVCLFEELPRQIRCELLATAKHHRRAATVRRISKEWWQSSALGHHGRKQLATVSEDDLTASIAHMLQKREMTSAHKAYAVWRACAACGPDDLGLVFLPGTSNLNGLVTVVASMLQDSGGSLWDFLDDSGMLNWSMPQTKGSHSDSESSDLETFDSNCSESDAGSDDDSVVEAGEEVCKRARIQLLIFEVIANRIKDAVERACPEIMKYIACSVDESVSTLPLQEQETTEIIQDNRCDTIDLPGDDFIEEAAHKNKARESSKRGKKKQEKQMEKQSTEAKRSKPQPARSAYQIFLAENTSEKAKVKELWHELPADDRQRFESMAAEEKRLHREHMDEWQKRQEKAAKAPKERNRGKR